MVDVMLYSLLLVRIALISEPLFEKMFLVGCTIASLLTALASYNVTWYTVWRCVAAALAHGSVRRDLRCYVRVQDAQSKFYINFEFRTLPVACVFAVEYVGVQYRSWAAAFGYLLFDVG